MRTDMAQLLVERPRLYRVEKYRGHRRRLNRDPDSASTKQGMRRPYFERKHFNEYFSPVLGFLRKNCGRPWNKVFSELSASLSGGGTVIDHVKVHVLRDFVILNPVWHNGVACYPPHSFLGNRSTPVPIEGRRSHGGFYVDRSGLLQRARTARREATRKKKIERLQIDNRTAYYKIDEAWFRVWTRPLEAPSAESVPLYDVVLKKWVKCCGKRSLYPKTRLILNPQAEDLLWTWYVEGTTGTWELERIHGEDRIAYRKEQISKRTIRRERLNELIR